MNRRHSRITVLLIALVGASMCLSACSSPRSKPTATVGSYKIGQPYQINGKWYYPKEDFSYNKTGVASWYGPRFHGKKTANGETFDQNAMTAAHPTLPMPSLVKVTNLANGKTATVRINDRGPFASNRIIDLSRAAARALDFENKGTTQVRVRILAAESRMMKVAASGGASTATATTVSTDPRPAPTTRAPAPIVMSDSGTVFTPSGTYYVQIGAFANQLNATGLLSKMNKYGNALVSPAHFGDHTMYRVRLGPFGTESDASRTLQNVRRDGYLDARVVNN